MTNQLTPEEARVNSLTAADITRFLDGFDLRCPVCQKDEFLISTREQDGIPMPVYLLSEASQGFTHEGKVGITSGRYMAPDVQIICATCAHALRFSSVVLAKRILEQPNNSD